MEFDSARFGLTGRCTGLRFAPPVSFVVSPSPTLILLEIINKILAKIPKIGYAAPLRRH